MKKNTLFIILAVFALFLCVSCTTMSKTEPIDLDLSEQIDLVFTQRPDNSNIRIIAEPCNYYEIALNCESFFYAWDMWQAYAESLEKTLVSVEESLRTSY